MCVILLATKRRQVHSRLDIATRKNEPVYITLQSLREVNVTSLGEKRTCASCGAKFYDLGKTPIVCPKCSATLNIAPEKPAKQPKKPSEGTVKVKEAKKVTHIDELDEDLDLSEFDSDDEEVSSEDSLETLDDLDELEEMGGDIESLSELEEREREEDHINSDDAEEDAFIEEMDQTETLVDKPEDDDGDEDDDILKEA